MDLSITEFKTVLHTKPILPSIKKMFIPDPGFLICDSDLAQADVQVVAAEADDQILKDIFADPDKDLHDENTKLIFGNNLDFKQFRYKRKLAKMAVHLTNYGGRPYTLSTGLGMSIKEAERFQNIWFEAHPGILEWHKRIRDQLYTRRYIENAFGNRKTYMGRIDHNTALNEALAWIPQSTVGLVINRAWLNLYLSYDTTDLQVLLQVHDSLVYQIRKTAYHKVLETLEENLLITVPYEEPLIIGVGFSASPYSWHDCKDISWDNARGQ